MLSTLRAYLPKLLVLAALGILGGAGTAQADAAPSSIDRPEFTCDPGEFCSWSGDFYSETMHRLDLRTTNPQECIAVPDGMAKSFANRLERDVTVYQDVDCSTEGDFITYPGHDTYAPHAPFLVRAVKIWD